MGSPEGGIQMIIGLPVVEGHELTKVAVEHLAKNAVLGETRPVIIDNGSLLSYEEFMRIDPDCGCHKIGDHKVGLIRNEENIGYYQPLKQLYDAYPDEEYIGLMHNDLMLYEPGWDRRMAMAFNDDPQLEVKVGDQTWKGQDPSAGRRINGIEPAIVLDSLFMLFRRDVIPHLVRESEKWEDITLAHFYDRIWPIRTIEAGYHVVTMGSDNDHIGGMTTTGNERYRNDCIKFLDERGIAWREDESGIIAAEREDPRNKPCGNPETQMYLIAEDRYLQEYRDQKHWLPAIIREGYDVTHLA